MPNGNGLCFVDNVTLVLHGNNARIDTMLITFARVPKKTSGKNVFPLPKWDRQNLHDENIDCNDNLMLTSTSP